MSNLIFTKLSADRVLWLISCALFTGGIVLPMFTFHNFLFFDDTFSLIGSIVHLFNEGQFFLFFVMLSFSIIGPLYKLTILSILISEKPIDDEHRIKLVQRLAILGKWSMADVFVVAILASTIKMGFVASVSIHSGLVIFGLAVIASIVMVQKQLSGYELRPINQNA
jgi:paraquat-inducible protein A